MSFREGYTTYRATPIARSVEKHAVELAKFGTDAHKRGLLIEIAAPFSARQHENMREKFVKALDKAAALGLVPPAGGWDAWTKANFKMVRVPCEFSNTLGI